MIVVSDTSLVTNLIAIGQAHVLPALFGDIIIPPEVQQELRRTHATVPPFLTVRVPKDLAEVRRLAATLDQGEAEAITLAVEIHADALLLARRGNTSRLARDRVARRACRRSQARPSALGGRGNPGVGGEDDFLFE